MDMTLGDTRLIVDECREEGATLEQTAYILATARWETNHTMKPVEEAYWLSKKWRKNNLHYYPWHGRGYVQLTWERNYQRASEELDVDLTTDPDLAMIPEIAAAVLVTGCMEGWFTGKKLPDYINDEKVEYQAARRVVNGTDKASEISALAVDYEEALASGDYGDEEERTSPAQSTTMQATATAAVTTGTGAVTAVGGLDGTAQLVVIGAAALGLLALAWIARERLRKWAEGDR